MLINQQVATALQLLHTQIRWKPGSLEKHLLSRKKRKHLPPTATIADYEALIHLLVATPANPVYLYQVNNVPYVTVVEAAAPQRPWLVMFDLNGLMETAFIVENPTSYLSKPEFSRLGTIQELLAL